MSQGAEFGVDVEEVIVSGIETLLEEGLLLGANFQKPRKQGVLYRQLTV